LLTSTRFFSSPEIPHFLQTISRYQAENTAEITFHTCEQSKGTGHQINYSSLTPFVCHFAPIGDLNLTSRLLLAHIVLVSWGNDYRNLPSSLIQHMSVK
jgi:hypothetical protein